MLKKDISELEAIIMTIRVVESQKGPYKSGWSLTTYLNVGFRNIADLILYPNCSSYTWK